MQALKSRGQIWVEAETTPDGETRVRIRDDGPGIPDQDRVRVFEALFTTKAKGSGLGLALCRRIMEAHGGGIEIEKPAAGASFLLTFPGGGAP
jgi:signal transduction histidine kinase